MVRSRLPEEQQRESTARCALEQLVKFLVKAANNVAQHGPLGAGRAAYWGRATVLSTIVDRQLKVILEHPDAGVRADQLIDLHDLIETVASIGPCLKTPAAKRLRAAPLIERRVMQAQAQASKSAEIIEEEFVKLRENHPDHDFQKDGPWKTGRVQELRRAIKQRREKEKDLQPYKPDAEADTIGRHLAELPFFDSD
jgi:hypothetical protein